MSIGDPPRARNANKQPTLRSTSLWPISTNRQDDKLRRIVGGFLCNPPGVGWSFSDERSISAEVRVRHRSDARYALTCTPVIRMHVLCVSLFYLRLCRFRGNRHTVADPAARSDHCDYGNDGCAHAGVAPEDGVHKRKRRNCHDKKLRMVTVAGSAEYEQDNACDDDAIERSGCGHEDRRLL